METKLENDQLTVKFADRLDAERAKEIDRQLNEFLEKKGVKTVIFDLAGVDYIASSFLRVCISMKKRLTIKSFKIINITPMIKKVFKISGLDYLLEIN